MTDEKKPVYGFFVHTKEDTSFSSGKDLTVKLYMVTLENGKIKNLSGSFGDPLGDFTIRAFVFGTYDYHGSHDTYFDPCGKVEYSDAKRYVKTFAKLEKGLAKLNETYGSTNSFGETVARIAKVLGVKNVIFEKEHYGSSYDDNIHTILKPGEAVWKLDSIIRDWKVKNPTPNKEASNG